MVLPAVEGGRIRETGRGCAFFGERTVLTTSLTGARDLRCLAGVAARSIVESVMDRFPRVVRRDMSLLVMVVLDGTFKGTFGGAETTDRRRFLAGRTDLRVATAGGITDLRFNAAPLVATGGLVDEIVPTLGAGTIDFRLAPTLIESPTTSSFSSTGFLGGSAATLET